MNLFRKKQQQPVTPLKERENLALMAVMKSIEKLQTTGLIYMDEKLHRVVISLDLALLFIQNTEKWTNFLNNLQMWFAYESSRKAWDKYFLEVEVKAVREARKKYAALTSSEERSIRVNARAQVDIDAVALPPVQPFDFVVASARGVGDEQKIIVVGHFADGKFEMIPYEEVNIQ